LLEDGRSHNFGCSGWRRSSAARWEEPCTLGYSSQEPQRHGPEIDLNRYPSVFQLPDNLYRRSFGVGVCRDTLHHDRARVEARPSSSTHLAYFFEDCHESLRRFSPRRQSRGWVLCLRRRMCRAIESALRFPRARSRWSRNPTRGVVAKAQQRFCHQRYLRDLDGVRLKDATGEWGRLSLTVASSAPLD